MAHSSRPDSRSRSSMPFGFAARSFVKAPIALPSSAGRPSPSPFQNGNAPGLPEGGGHEHAVGGDLFDAPARRAEGDDIRHPGFVDHLLVEFTNPPWSAALS